MLLLLGACSPEPEGDVVGVWVLETVAVNGVFVALPESVLSGEQSVPELEIQADGTFGLSGICNSLDGEGTFGNRFLSGDVVSTTAGCLPAGDGEFEKLVFDVIYEQPRIEFGTEQAMQLQGDTTTLTFRRQP